MADSEPRLSELIRHHYMIPKYHIDRLYVRFNRCGKTSIDERSLFIRNVDTILKFTLHFGDLITKLLYSTRDCVFTTEESDAIANHIEQYCSKTLVELQLIHPQLHLIGKTSSVLERVKRLQIWRFDDCDKLDIARIFPLLEDLRIDSDIDLNGFRSLARSYQHLQHLELFILGRLENGSAVQEIFKFNPQLHSLVLDFPDLESLHIISQSLPRLEQFELFYSTKTDRNTTAPQNANFKSVKTFKITFNGDRSDNNRVIPITFDQLETLEIISECLSNPIQAFIDHNKGLKRLSLPRIFEEADYVRAATTISRLSALEELFIAWSNEFDILHRIGKSNSNLKKIISNGRHSNDTSVLDSTNWQLINVDNNSSSPPTYFTYVRRKDADPLAN